MKERMYAGFLAAGIALFLTGGGTLFAQDKTAAPENGAAAMQKAAVSFDFVPLVRANILEEDKAGFGGALNGEYFIAKNYSLGLRIEWVTVPGADRSYFGIDGHFRFYFKDAGISGFFCDMGVGWGGVWARDWEDKTKLEAGGLTYNLKLGYKQIIFKKFFVEPGFSYTLAKPTSGYGPGGFDLSFSAGLVF